ncbi:hypothetical protein GCM10010430_18820 [Kitasatospora cystarginea]|uniref:Lsr2 DNA-binding domain-containing protein n=1 Tax=Kitasatospora cystarginea TaxID=58350 RepID=A0ABP5QJY5_9ACTN
MRKTVQVVSYVEKTVCDGCAAKDGSDVEASEVLTLSGVSYDLCTAHAEKFGAWFAEAFGPSSIAEPSVSEAEQDDPDDVEEPEGGEGHEKTTEVAPVPSVMIAGEVPGYDWDTAREAVRNLGYEVLGRADSSTVLLILGEGGERNTTKLNDAAKFGLPCMDVRQRGRFKSAVCAGELVGGDPLPEPVRVGRSGMSDRERNRLIRAWAQENGYAVPARGRIPMHISHAYKVATAQDTTDAKESHTAA